MKKFLWFISLLPSVCFTRYEKFVLIIPLYNEQHPYRIEEYLTCLQKNMRHKDIAEIHVVYDNLGSNTNQKIITFLKNHNIPITYVSHRQTFHDLFEVARLQYPSRNVIVSNADIYFNKTLSLLTKINLENLFIALTVWDVKPNGKIMLRMKNGKVPASDSMDTWIFRSPIRPFALEEIEIGTMTCENRLAFYADKAGLILFNPALSVQACHLHLSKIRSLHGRKPKKVTDRRGIKVSSINDILTYLEFKKTNNKENYKDVLRI